jgi:hypothetical protein
MLADDTLARFINNTDTVYRVRPSYDVSHQPGRTILATRMVFVAGGVRLERVPLVTTLGMTNPHVDVLPGTTLLLSTPDSDHPVTMVFTVMAGPRDPYMGKFVGTLYYTTSSRGGQQETFLRSMLDGFVTEERVAPETVIINPSKTERSLAKRLDKVFDAAADTLLRDTKAGSAAGAPPEACTIM